LWLLSADQIADQLAERPCELDRCVEHGKSNARTLLFGDRPVVESLFTHYLNLKLGEVNFKELTYDLAEVIYEYPFRLPANFTYIMRALMTLEGIGVVTDPGFSFFETAKPFAKEFMLRREGRAFRKLILDKLTGRENGDSQIAWSRVWKLTKMAAKMYLDRQT